jgi:acyl carrier protein
MMPPRVDTACRVMHIAPRNRNPESRATFFGQLMLIDDVKRVVGVTLNVAARVERMDESAPLLGAVPELDSIAVVSLITAVEEHFGITVADDEIGASTFETLGSLARFVEQKLAE